MKFLRVPKIVKENKLKWSGASYNQKNVFSDNQSQNIYDQLSFSRQIVHQWKSLIAIFRDFFASINKVLILEGALGTGLSSYKV